MIVKDVTNNHLAGLAAAALDNTDDDELGSQDDSHGSEEGLEEDDYS